MDTNKKILIVEDSKNYLWIISNELERQGYIVFTAENGEDGLVAAKKEKPDLILLDIEMRKMDGMTMSKKLREFDTKTPIIFLTNRGDLKHISDAIEVAADYIIKSDINTEGIADRVKERLNLK